MQERFIKSTEINTMIKGSHTTSLYVTYRPAVSLLRTILTTYTQHTTFIVYRNKQRKISKTKAECEELSNYCHGLDLPDLSWGQSTGPQDRLAVYAVTETPLVYYERVKARVIYSWLCLDIIYTTHYFNLITNVSTYNYQQSYSTTIKVKDTICPIVLFSPH